MTWDDCGLKVAKVCSTSTAAGLCGFLASQAEIHSQSPGMGTGRFGSATTTTASSIGRQRAPFSAFLGRDSDTVTRREALLPDRPQGGLWLGFVEGGIAYLKDGQIRSSYNAAEGLGNGAVMDLQYGSDGAVWAATEGGLSRVKDGRITTLTSKNGLPCDAVHWAIEDNDHSFWLYMPCGLVRIARSELDAWVSDSKRAIQTKVFDSSDGVWSLGRNGRHTPYVTKSPDGKIWFSAPDGVSVIDPRHLPFNKLPPPVHIEQITADGKSLRFRAVACACRREFATSRFVTRR